MPSILDEIRDRIERIREQGLIPTVRSRVEEVTVRMRERVTGSEEVSGLTKEKESRGGLEI